MARNSSVQDISAQDIRKIIVDGNAKLLIEGAERLGRDLATDGLSKSQIRGIFGTVRQIQASWQKDVDATQAKTQLRQILLLKPRLAYQAKRDGKVKPLANVLTNAIGLVADGKSLTEQTERFGYFVDLFEAILAYHTAYGGK